MHGHTLVPREYVVNGLNLGKWVNNQRTQYALKEKGKEDSWLTDERVRLLNNIHFAWSARDEIWDNNLRALAAYKKDHNGDICVPQQHTTKEGLTLGEWVHTQRKQYALKEKGKDTQMTDERVLLLNALSFVWNALEAQWLENYEALQQFKEAYGHVSVKQRYKTEEGLKLGMWVHDQRIEWKKKKQNGKHS